MSTTSSRIHHNPNFLPFIQPLFLPLLYPPSVLIQNLTLFFITISQDCPNILLLLPLQIASLSSQAWILRSRMLDRRGRGVYLRCGAGFGSKAICG